MQLCIPHSHLLKYSYLGKYIKTTIANNFIFNMAVHIYILHLFAQQPFHFGLFFSNTNRILTKWSAMQSRYLSCLYAIAFFYISEISRKISARVQQIAANVFCNGLKVLNFKYKQATFQVSGSTGRNRKIGSFSIAILQL